MSFILTLKTKTLNLKERVTSVGTQSVYVQLELESRSVQMTPSWVFSLQHAGELLF